MRMESATASVYLHPHARAFGAASKSGTSSYYRGLSPSGFSYHWGLYPLGPAIERSSQILPCNPMLPGPASDDQTKCVDLFLPLTSRRPAAAAAGQPSEGGTVAGRAARECALLSSCLLTVSCPQAHPHLSPLVRQLKLLWFVRRTCRWPASSLDSSTQTACMCVRLHACGVPHCLWGMELQRPVSAI